ncbi:MAG: ankyrin repeat domain-containing protein, partial [Planctomycetota bacterium]
MLLRGRGLLLGLVLLTSLLGGGGLLRAQEYEYFPLHAAARDDDLTRVRSLVEAGAAIDARDNDGWTPLMLAAANSTTPEIVQLLLDKGAAIDARDLLDKTPLMLAADHSTTPEIVQLLLDKGAAI